MRSPRSREVRSTVPHTATKVISIRITAYDKRYLSPHTSVSIFLEVGVANFIRSQTMYGLIS
jgi:hypothetical protein